MRPVRFLALSTLLLLSSATAALAQIQTGNLIVVQVGTGGTLSSTGTVVTLKQHDTAGNPSGTNYALPTSVSGPNRRLVVVGTDLTQGAISQSQNSNYLTLAGYDGAVGQANLPTTGGISRVVARVSLNGTIDTTTAFSAYTGSGSSIRSATTEDGSQFWVGGTGTNGGVRTIAHGGTSSTSVAATPNDTRVVGISNGQLYVSSTGAGNVGINQVGTGIPTGSGNTNTLLTGSSATNAYAFAFADLDAGEAGDDTLYVANTTGLQKFGKVAGTWSL
ncbi:MAG: ExeM/NucH family extracellular endonuclease, partial [Gemmataceae bacterium]